MAFNSADRSRVRRGLDELTEFINANRPTRARRSTRQETVEIDPRMVALVARRQTDIRRRNAILAEPKIPCHLPGLAQYRMAG